MKICDIVQECNSAIPQLVFSVKKEKTADKRQTMEMKLK